MKIDSAKLQMASSHASLQHRETKESLKMWSGQQRPAFAGETPRPRLPGAENVSLSEAGKAASAAPLTEEEESPATEEDYKLTLIRTILEFLTGRKLDVFDASELEACDPANVPCPPQASPAQSVDAPPPAGYGIEYDYHESYTEAEQTDFSASGTVKTADGREISFNLQLSMSRYYHEESNVSLRLGDAARKTDPLVLNFAGTAAQLTDQRFSFDLNADGKAEQINFTAPGSGFLVFDRNQNGKVDNGGELFGPTSGDGFSELATLDADHNGWIDENDAAFDQLQVWTQSDGNKQLRSLRDAGVGAIALNRVSTPFELKTNANELLGQIRTSGIFLQESGAAGTIQQIDLTA